MNLTWFTKPFCRFLIHRYMGQYLKTEITTDQLELKLQDGIASIQKVNLNVEYIDGLVEQFGVVRVHQGYVEEICVSVPWTKIMVESTVIRVKGLDLTLSPLKSLDTFNAQELVSSMVGSMASNLELARSFISNEDEMPSEDPENGVDHLADLFDKVIGRIKIIFENTTIRLETESDLATGLEFQIDRMEFVDEKLDACEQNQGDAPITAQPTRFSAVTELNKLLHVQGVRVYTDIWSNYRDTSSIASSQDFGSSESTRSTTEHMVASNMVSSNFQSCYSNFPEKKASIGGSQPSNQSTDSSNSNSNMIQTNPILIAQLFGERSTLRIRVYNTALSTRADAAFNKKLEIDIQLVGNAFVFLTPTQLALICDLLSQLSPSSQPKPDAPGTFNAAGGHPMRPEHFAHIMNAAAASAFSGDHLPLDQLLGQPFRDTASHSSNAISGNAASGSTTFHEFQRNGPQRRSASVAITNQKFTTISLQDDGGDHQHRRHGSGSAAVYGAASQASADSDSLTDRHGSNLTLTERRPDLIEFNVRAPGLVAIITHEDPLSSYLVFGALNTHSDLMSPANVASIRAQIAKLSEMSAQFFKHAAKIKLTSWESMDSGVSPSALEMQRQASVALYPKDHLKVLCRRVFFQFHNECDGQRSIFDLKCKVHECDVSEFLIADSIYQPNVVDKSNAHFDILNFSDHAEGTKEKHQNQPHLQFQLKNFHEREHHRRVEFNLLPCKSHFDLSIIDRVSHLIQPRPFFTAIQNSSASTLLGAPLSSAPGRDDFIFNEPTVGLRDNFMQLASTLRPPSTTETYGLIFNCAQWLIDLRVPRADYTQSAPAYTIKNLHDEFLRLNVKNASLDLGRFHLNDLTQHGQMNLKCQSISGEFIGDQEFLASHEHKFFHASSNSSSTGLDKSSVQITIKYDNRNRQLQQQLHSQGDDSYNPMIESMHPKLNIDMARSMYGSFCPQTDKDEYDEGPFARARDYYGEERLISAGTHKELEQFAMECLLASTVTVELDIPQLNVLLPSHMFLEVLYNRFANDFALWSLRAPVFTNNSHSPDLQSTLTPLQPIGDYSARTLTDRPFLEFDSEANRSRKQRSGGSSSTNADYDLDETHKTESHLFALQVKAKTCRVLMQTPIKHEIKREDQSIESEEFGAQLGVELNNGQFFVVHGYNKTPGLDYLFVSAAKTLLYHRNLLNQVRPFVCNVSEPNFAAHHRNDIHAEPFGAKMDSTELEDNLAVAIKIFNNLDDNQRNITLAVSVRNTLLHYRPVLSPIHYWPQQFANFFDLVDYGVPGYEWPQLVMDLHVQLKNTTFSYDHSAVVPESPMVLRAIIGTCHFSAGIYQLTEKLNLTCLLEDSRLYLSKRPPKQVQFAGGKASSSNKGAHTNKSIDVKVGEIGLLHANLEYTLAGATEADCQPTWDLRMKNDVITLWLCSDTIVELKTLLVEFMSSDVGKAIIQNAASAAVANDLATAFEADAAVPQIPESVSSASNLNEMATGNSLSNLRTRPSASSLTSAMTAVSHPRQLTEEQQDSLKEMLSLAMEEEPKSSNVTKKHENNPFDDEDPIFDSPPPLVDLGTHQSDDDFVHLDEYLGSGITNARGEPKVRVLEEDGFVIVPNHLRQPSEEQNTEMMRFPDEHPRPINTLSIEEFSLCVYLFGGSDFVDTKPEQRTYSLWEHKRESLECMRDGSEGGPNRDHTVCVQAKISKVSFIRKLFAPNAPTLSASMLTVGDVEVLDHLLISNINKLFYQYVDSILPRRLNAPLLSVRIIEDQFKEGKLKISLLPLRLNIDQDTLEFLTDYINTVSVCGAGIAEDSTDDPTSTHMPLMEVNEHRPPVSQIASSPPNQEPVVTWTKGAIADDSDDSNDEGETDEISVLKDNALFDPFDESDINFEDEFGDLPNAHDHVMPTRFEPARQSRSSIVSAGTNASTSPRKARRPSAQSGTLDDQMAVGASASNSNIIRPSCSTPSVSDSNCTSATSTVHKRVIVQTNATFFKEFTFEPSCIIRFDYVGKRVKTDQGALIGFLKGMMETKCTQLALKEIRNERGILGWNKCVAHALNEWSADLRLQLPSTLASYGPITSLVQIGQGVRDLFYIPMMEMRREDGRLIRGIHRGATSFGTSTATAAIDAAQQVVVLVQGIAEFAFDLVTPDLPYRDHRRHNALTYHTVRVPGDIREGASMAYDTVVSGVRDTARSLHNAAQDDRARLANEPAGFVSALAGSRGIIRQFLPTITRTVVVSAQATNQFLGGFKNQLKPDEHQEELHKWRQGAPAASQRQHPRHHQKDSGWK